MWRGWEDSNLSRLAGVRARWRNPERAQRVEGPRGFGDRQFSRFATTLIFKEQ
jgi:hypothetical protein